MRKTPRVKKGQQAMKSSQIMIGVVMVGLLSLSTILFLHASQTNQDVRTKAATLTNCDISDAEIATDANEQKMLELVNAHRQQNGAGPLQFSTTLNRTAAWMSKDMSTRQVLDHTDSLNRDPQTRLKDCGETSKTTGENVAYNSNSTPENIFEAWKASSGHNQNMLNPDYKFIGVAQSGIYWTQEFGDVDSGGGTVAPTTAAGTTPGTTTVPVIPSASCLGGCPTLMPSPTGSAGQPVDYPTGTVLITPGTSSPTLPGGTNLSDLQLIEFILRLLALFFGFGAFR